MPEAIRNGLEHNLSNILSALAIAAILWTGNKLMDQQERLVRLEVQMESISAKLDAMHRAMVQLNSIDKRVTVLEGNNGHNRP